MYFGTRPYGIEEHVREYGNGDNMYRGADFGQPNTLEPGDVLATGLTLINPPEDGGNGGVVLRFTDGTKRTVPGRIPLLLKSNRLPVLPYDLRIGNILETGDVVLSTPSLYDQDDPRYEEGESEVDLHLTGGFEGHHVGTPRDLAIATLAETYPPNSETVMGQYIIRRVLKMYEPARQHLQNLGQIAFQL